MKTNTDYLSGGELIELLNSGNVVAGPGFSANSNTEGAAKPEQERVNIDDFVAHMPTHKYIFLPTGDLWPAPSVDARVGPQIDPATGKQISASKYLDHYKPVDQMTWAPGMPQLIEGKLTNNGGWIDSGGAKSLNLYRPPNVTLGDPNLAGPWIDHIRLVFPDDAAHIIRWLAHRVQRPQEKINHALMFGGPQGIGKDTILEPVKHAVGAWNFNEVSPEKVYGRFNDFVQGVILRISEAKDLGEINRFAFYERMKTYTVTPPDVLPVEKKHINTFNVLNCVGVVITTNYKAGGIYLPEDDRRHYVAWSEMKRESFDLRYWNTLWDWYNNGGFGHVAAYLARLDISDFNPKAPPVKTAAFWDMVGASQAPDGYEISDAIDLLGNPDALTIDDIVSKICTDDPGLCEELVDRKNSHRNIHRLHEAGYTRVSNLGAKDKSWKIGKKRRVVFAKESLTPAERLTAVQDRVRRATLYVVK